MTRILDRLSFRARLTLWWTFAFGLVLTTACLAIYSAFRVYLYDDFDVNLRTVAATELASSTDRTDIHLHELPTDAFADGRMSDKFVQILEADGRLRLSSRSLGGVPPLISPTIAAEALEGRGPLVPVIVSGRPARAAAMTARTHGKQYVVLVGMFHDSVDAHLARLAWLLTAVWLAAMGATTGVGYWLASRALAPIVGITRRAARIATGEFSTRLDEPSSVDEVGQMTRSLNDVLERLHGALEANRSFASDASHELRAPLTAMASAVDVTLKHRRSEPEYREALAAIRDRLTAMTRLCTDLMLLAHAQEGGQGLDLREIPLRSALEDSVARLSDAAASRGITIAVAAVPELVAYADSRLMARVLDNVLSNAVHHNRDGGAVHVTGRTEDAGAGEWKPGTAVLTIADTGPGIPPEAFARVFDRFYRVDRSRTRDTGGSGLGLAICREILTVLGGSIRIVESSAAGTTFEIAVPGRAAAERRVSA